MTGDNKNHDFLSKLHAISKMKLSRDALFQIILTLIACNIFVILGVMIFKIGQNSWLSIQTYGMSFLWGTSWIPNPTAPGALPSFGALPLIWGTLVTSGIALLLGVPVSLGISLVLSEFAPKSFNYVVSFFVELLAAIPSVIYGLWGIFVLIPFLQGNAFPALQSVLGFLPFSKAQHAVPLSSQEELFSP